MKSTMKTSTERNVEIRSNRNRKQKIERRAFADSCIATWPVGYWDTMVRHMMKSFSRFDVPCTCYAGFAESKRQPDLVRVLRYIFPNRTTRGCAAAPRRSPQRRWTGTGCLRRVCNSKNDPCTSIRSFIHRYKIRVNVYIVFWMTRVCLSSFSRFPVHFSFHFVVDRRKLRALENADYFDIRGHGTWSCENLLQIRRQISKLRNRVKCARCRDALVKIEKLWRSKGYCEQ